MSPTIRNKKCSRAPSPALPLTASRNMSAERIYVSEGPVTMSSTQDDQSIGSVAEPDFGINMYCNETDMPIQCNCSDCQMRATVGNCIYPYYVL